MKNKHKRFPHLPLLIAGAAVILSSGVGIAHIVGGSPIASDDAVHALAPDGLPSVKARCAECGVIVSMREIELRPESTGFSTTGGAVAGNREETRGKSTKRHELTIRLPDRSSRVIVEANSAKWRLGERVVVIDGAYPSTQ